MKNEVSASLIVLLLIVMALSGCTNENIDNVDETNGTVDENGGEAWLLETKFSFVEGDSESWSINWRRIGQEVLSPSWFRFEYLGEGPSLRCRQFGSFGSAINNVDPLGEVAIDYINGAPSGYSFAFGEDSTLVNINLGLWNLPPNGYAIYKYEVTGEKIWTFEGICISGEVGNEIGLDPEVFQLPDGSYRMYLADSESPEIGVIVADSPDGLIWTIEPWREDVVGDGPSIIELPDGLYRAYWQRKSGNWEIMTAVSSDGYNWEDETVCTSPNIEDFYGGLPSVIILPDETYRMYYTRETGPSTQRVWSIYSAHSSDGLVWEPDPGIRIDGAEKVDRNHASSGDVYIREDGKYEMFYISGGVEIYRAVSDDGLNWTRMGYTGLEGLDPIINVFPDGTIRMYYATTAADWFPPSDKPPGIYSATRESL